MRITEKQVFIGTNIYAPVPVFGVKLELDASETSLLGTEHCKILIENLKRLEPSLRSQLSIATPEPELFPPNIPPTFAEIVTHVTLALQNFIGFEVSFGKVLSEQGPIKICFQHKDPACANLCLRNGLNLILSSLGENNLPILQQNYSALLKRLPNHLPSLVTRRILQRADQRDIPWCRLHPEQTTFILGQGKHQQRFIGCITDESPAIATKLSTSKKQTRDFLFSHGLPVPPQRLVYDAREATKTAEEFGYPVVVKPEKMDRGVGVSINLEDRGSVERAYSQAAEFGQVLIEKQISGQDYRITLIDHKIIAVARKELLHVIGDGKSTVKGLIENLNKDPRRGNQLGSLMPIIDLDEKMTNILEEQGFTSSSIPEESQRVRLRRWWRPEDDYLAQDETDNIHPDNKIIFERASRLIGLDLTGIDFFTTDITKSWCEVGGVILEVNATPGLNVHIRAQAPDVLGMVLDHKFPGGIDGRIPTAVIVGTHEILQSTANKLSHLGQTLSLSSEAGVWIGEDKVFSNNAGGQLGINMVLGDPATELAVMQTSPDLLVLEGLPINWVDVTAIVNHHLSDISDEQMLGLIRLAEATRKTLVLNKDMALSQTLAERSKAEKIKWISAEDHPDTSLEALAANAVAEALGPLVS